MQPYQRPHGKETQKKMEKTEEWSDANAQREATRFEDSKSKTKHQEPNTTDDYNISTKAPTLTVSTIIS